MKQIGDFPLVSIIIDNWNGINFLNDCLKSVSSLTYPNFEVIVIDDGSNDGSGKFIEKKFKKVILIKNVFHLGFAKANMIGVKKAKGKYLLFLNNDTVVTGDFIFPLVKLMESDLSVGAVQPKIRGLIDKNKLDDVVNYLTPFGFFYHLGYGSQDYGQYDKKMFTFTPKGACFITRKDIFTFLKGFDENYYCYCEESDYAWRLWLSGRSIYFEPKSVIYHFGGGSLHNQTSFNREYLSKRNRLSSLLTNLSFGGLMIILPLHLVFLSVDTLFFLLRGKFKIALSAFKAIGWNINNINKVLEKRKFVQNKIRKISDFKIFKLLMKMPSVNYFNNFLKNYRSVDSLTKRESK